MIQRFTLTVLMILTLPALGHGQATLPDISGTYRAETPDGPTEVVVRPDSSASLGEETVRWRLEGDSLLLAFGDEWMAYRYVFRNQRLTLSGGDLEEPVELEHTGPASPRPAGTPVPPAPPSEKRVTP